MKNKKFIVKATVWMALWLCFPIISMAQVSLRVFESRGKQPLDNVSVLSEGKEISRSDKNGQVFIPSTLHQSVELVKDGYVKTKVSLREDVLQYIFLDPTLKDEVELSLYGNRKREYVTAATSTLFGETVANLPGTNRINTLVGRIAGLGITQGNGFPGDESSTMQIRGQHTFGNHPGVIVLVDGLHTDYNMLDPYDIEKVTVLKDAAATAIYGLHGANGVLLIETKRGKEGRLKVNYNAQVTAQEPLRLPKFLDSYNYAVLYNEAMLNDNPTAIPKYSADDIEGYRTGKSPYAYPNVDWTNLFLRKYSLQTRHNVNLSGGSDVATYYASFGYVSNGGVFSTDKKINTYNTNSGLSAFNAHGNVTVNLGKRFKVEADIKAKKDKRNYPGAYSNSVDQTVLSMLYATPFNAYQPITFNGQLGGWVSQVNPYGYLNYSGYSNFETNYISTNVRAIFDLEDLVKGLSIDFNFGMNSSTDYTVNRTKTFAYYYQTSDGIFWRKSGEDGTISSGGGYKSLNRRYEHGVSLNYNRDFSKHHIDGMVRFDRLQKKEHMYSSIGETYQGLRAKIGYRFDDKYLVDLTASYQGCNYFPSSKRYGFFPALSAGWLLSNEEFLKGNKNINYLKVRGSIGQVGNTIGSAWATYYGYLSNFEPGQGAIFGSSLTQSPGMVQSRVANEKITWETITKFNIGVDFALLQNRLTGSIDYFTEKNKDILVQNAISSMFGADVWMPEGEMSNKGVEVDLKWSDHVADFYYYIGGNYAFARNTIDYQNEEFRSHQWNYRTGHPYATRFGYVFDRYFTEDDDLSSLPDQSLLGSVQPGDLKYKDLNGDGVIDEKDQRAIGRGKTPEIYYGINLGASYKGVDISCLFQGVANTTTYNSGYRYHDFNAQTGNVLEHHLKRWTPGSGQNAAYPRLSLNAPNNYQTSSFWVEKANFLRLKNLEVGYTLPRSWTDKMGMTRLRVFLNGTNLICWDDVKHKDPEGLDSGMRYPNVRTVTGGLNVSF